MLPRVVLITGVGGFLGGRLAARLAEDDRIERIIGVDVAPPGPELRARMGRAEYVRADIRNPLIAKLVATAGVDTVVHAAVSSNPGSGGHGTLKETNVVGTMQLLAACQQSDRVRRLVVKSTSAVYGSSSDDPAVFTEDTEPRDVPSGGHARDAVDAEAYVRGFGRRRPDVQITTLRFTDLIGPRVDGVLARYFALPVVPTVLGHDARMQFVHPEDALTVLHRAVLHDLPGVYNVGGDGVLMTSQAIRRAGRVSLPVPGPAVPSVGRVLRGARLVNFSGEQVRFLNYGRVVDTTRLAREFGYRPRWTTEQAFDEYVRGRGLRPVVDPESVRAAEHGVRSGIEQVAGMLR